MAAIAVVSELGGVSLFVVYGLEGMDALSKVVCVDAGERSICLVLALGVILALRFLEVWLHGRITKLYWINLTKCDK